MGGESGSNTRMMEPDWAYEMKQLCAAYGVPFFMKQMTDKEPIPEDLLVGRISGLMKNFIIFIINSFLIFSFLLTIY